MMGEVHRPHLVVIGSGWVGLYVAQHINTAIYSVSVISPRLTSAYTPLLASAASGLFPFRCAEEPIRAKGRRCDFIKAIALAVDFATKKVHCEAAFDDEGCSLTRRRFDIAYDKLIICPGLQTNTFGTPGAVENALFMKHVSDAMTLRKKLFDQLEKASLPCTTSDEASQLLHVAVVGGGPTGVELAAELSDLAQRELKDIYPAVAQLLRVTVFDVASHILGVYDKSLYEYATEHMVQHGVRVATNCVIEKVEPTRLHIKGQDPVPYGILLWVAGNKSVPFVDGLEVKKTEDGLVRILTDPRLRVKKRAKEYTDVYPDVFALGDAADIEGQSLPTTAEVAVQKAKYIVRQSQERLEGTEPFTFKSQKLVTYIGGHDGIIQGSLMDETWSGRQAWLSWRSGSFTWTRSWRNRVSMFIAIIMNTLFGKDVVGL